MDKKIIVALDAMGGDYAPVETVKGAVDAVKELNVDIKLVGREEEIKAEKKRCPVCFFKKRLSLAPTPQLEYTAAVSSYLIYHNVIDDIKD